MSDFTTIVATALVEDATAAAIIGAGATVTSDELGSRPRTIQHKTMEVVSVDDFDAVGDGVADDSEAWNRATAAAAGGKLIARQGAVYRLNSRVVLPNASLEIDLTGATILSSGEHRTFESIHNNTTAVTTIVSGAELKSRTVVVASPAGLSIGQWVHIYSDNAPIEDSLSYPAYFGRICGVTGDTVTLDEAISITYAGNVYFAAYSTLPAKLTIKNGVIDGSENTYDAGPGNGVYARQYIDVTIKDVNFNNWNNDGINTSCALIYLCKSGRFNSVTVDRIISKTQALEFQNVETAIATECHINGDSFGISFLRVMWATAENNNLIGRHIANVLEAISPKRSIRGIKTYGCGHFKATGNTVRDYSSPFKLESGWTFDVSNNWMGITIPDGSGGGVGINVSSHSASSSRQGNSRINGNTIIGMYSGIQITDLVGNNTISDNTIISMNIYGIDVYCPNNHISNNKIIDWAVGSIDGRAIILRHNNGKDVIKDNVFSNVEYGKVCLSVVSPNVRITKNRVLTATKLTLLFSAEECNEEIGAEVYQTTYIPSATGNFTDYILKPDGITSNVGKCYSSDNGKFTALLAGAYQITGCVDSAGITEAQSYGLVYVLRRNSATVILESRQCVRLETKHLVSVGNQVSFPFSTVMKLSAGDTVEIVFKVTGSTKSVAVSGLSATERYTWVSFQRIASN